MTRKIGQGELRRVEQKLGGIYELKKNKGILSKNRKGFINLVEFFIS